MSGTPLRVKPTDPPSSAILIGEHRQLQIRAGAADRVDYVFARLAFAETALLNGPTAHGRIEHATLSRPYLLAVEEPPASEPGWLLLAEVTVRAGQTTVEAGDIRPPGWHHQHGADEAPRSSGGSMTAINPLAAPCPACLAEPGEQCYATSSDEPRAIPHRLRGLAAAKKLRRCSHCHGVGWEPDGEDLEVAELERPKP